MNVEHAGILKMFVVGGSMPKFTREALGEAGNLTEVRTRFFPI
jgi:hypothetical protein